MLYQNFTMVMVTCHTTVEQLVIAVKKVYTSQPDTAAGKWVTGNKFARFILSMLCHKMCLHCIVMSPEKRDRLRRSGESGDDGLDELGC